jgi:carbamate kinase
VQAVVDKDLTAARIALALKADRLVVLTDVPGIIRGYGTQQASPIRTIDVAALAGMAFPAGSMGPKVDACVRFARGSGRPAAIGALADAAEVLTGQAGTTITPYATEGQR